MHNRNLFYFIISISISSFYLINSLINLLYKYLSTLENRYSRSRISYLYSRVTKWDNKTESNKKNSLEDLDKIKKESSKIENPFHHFLESNSLISTGFNSPQISILCQRGGGLESRENARATGRGKVIAAY